MRAGTEFAAVVRNVSAHEDECIWGCPRKTAEMADGMLGSCQSNSGNTHDNVAYSRSIEEVEASIPKVIKRAKPCKVDGEVFWLYLPQRPAMRVFILDRGVWNGFTPGVELVLEPRPNNDGRRRREQSRISKMIPMMVAASQPSPIGYLFQAMRTSIPRPLSAPGHTHAPPEFPGHPCPP